MYHWMARGRIKNQSRQGICGGKCIESNQKRFRKGGTTYCHAWFGTAILRSGGRLLVRQESKLPHERLHTADDQRDAIGAARGIDHKPGG